MDVARVDGKYHLFTKGGRVVKGVNFKGVQDVEDPVALARRYNDAGADELVFYEITASVEGRGLFTDVLRDVARQIFIPLTVGGAINTLEDFDRVLKAGADKVEAAPARSRRKHTAQKPDVPSVAEQLSTSKVKVTRRRPGDGGGAVAEKKVPVPRDDSHQDAASGEQAQKRRRRRRSRKPKQDGGSSHGSSEGSSSNEE